MVATLSGALSATAVPGTGRTALAEPPPQTTSLLTSPMFHISGLIAG